MLKLLIPLQREPFFTILNINFITWKRTLGEQPKTHFKELQISTVESCVYTGQTVTVYNIRGFYKTIIFLLTLLKASFTGIKP